MALSAAVTRAAYGGATMNQQVFVDVVTFAGDAAYATGGSANFSEYLRSKLGTPFAGRTLLHVLSGKIIIAGVLYHAVWDRANDKLMVFLASTGVEVANAVDLSASTMELVLLSQ